MSGFDRRPPGPPIVAALGGVGSLSRGQVALRLVLLLVVLGLALLVRATGVLKAPDPVLPPLPGAAQVVPGVLRAGAANETELMLMRDSFQVRAVVAIGDTTVEEQAVTEALGMNLITLEMSDVDAPTPAQVIDVVRFVRATTGGGRGTVFLHDDDGEGPVVATAAMVQLVDRVPLADVWARLTPEERRAVSPAQARALQAAATALAGGGPPTNPYAALREVAR